jgi:rare lipoprotein A
MVALGVAVSMMSLAGCGVQLRRQALALPPAAPPPPPAPQAREKAPSARQKIIQQVGEASWYGPYHQGKETASGETFDQNQLTAAHPTLPLGSKATVTNLATGKSVKVTINDRGPYVNGRKIDLSHAAARKIGLTKQGVAKVKITAVVPSRTRRTLRGRRLSSARQ